MRKSHLVRMLTTVIVVAAIGMSRSMANDDDDVKLGDPPLVIKVPALQFYNSCLNEAISSSMVESQGNTLSYHCFGETPQAWFDFLGQESEETRRDRHGLWLIRSFVGGVCGQHIQKADETATNEYSCTIETQAPR